MGKYIVDILDKDKYALEVDIMRNGSPASQRILDAVNAGTPYEEKPHGTWIDLGEDMILRWLCSKCGRKDRHIFNFCPDCGATMDERSDGNEKSRK